MAVHPLRYRAWDGPRTGRLRRFLVLPLYALAELAGSKLAVALLVAGLAWPVAAAVLIYLHHNAAALELLEIPVNDLLAIDGRFYGRLFLGVQNRMAFLFVLVSGTALLSPDLRENGLALYFARPLSRTGYVAGRLLALLVPLSLLTWIPGLLLFAEQAGLEGAAWAFDHLRYAAGILAVSWAWILLLGLLALAVSAWLKRRMTTRLAFLGVFFLLDAQGALINQIYATDWGDLLRVGGLLDAMVAGVFGLPPEGDLPPAAAWATFGLAGLACVGLLRWRLRAWEVVR